MPETFRCEYVKCGKAGCRSCPHGPYWYGYQKRAGRLHKRYIGKTDPRPKPEPKEKRNPWDDIFCRATATAKLAVEILGLKPGYTVGDLRQRFLHLTKIHHPDRGGDTKTFQYIQAAYSYLKSVYFG